jgi:hypothetical protein
MLLSVFLSVAVPRGSKKKDKQVQAVSKCNERKKTKLLLQILLAFSGESILNLLFFSFFLKPKL